MIRKGSKVRYIGDRFELAKGQTLTVLNKHRNGITLYFPIEKVGDKFRMRQCYMNIEDFEEVK